MVKTNLSLLTLQKGMICNLKGGHVRVAMRELYSEGLIVQPGGAYNPYVDDVDEAATTFVLTGAAIKHAESGSPRQVSSIPAADRYVTLSDNQKADIGDTLTELKEAVSSTNDVGDEERQIAFSEIAAFEATIVQQRVSTELIERFVNSVLKWLTVAFSAAAIQEVAQRLFEALLKLL